MSPDILSTHAVPAFPTHGNGDFLFVRHCRRSNPRTLADLGVALFERMPFPTGGQIQRAESRRLFEKSLLYATPPPKLFEPKVVSGLSCSIFS